MATQGRTQLGGHAFNHRQDSSAEAEYDRLRNLARQEHAKMQSCFERAHQAYSSGDGAEAHALSTAGKQHQAAAASYNAQASAFILRENNAVDRVAADTIDLHGQYVDEAEDILDTRIRAAVAQGQDHLHVIVGKGNHSPGHIQKIKPKVESVCQELGIRYETEENEGRIYLDLRGASHPPYQQNQQYQPQPQQQAYYPPQAQGPPQQQFNTQEQQQNQQDPLTACLEKCCAVM